ncbi:MAG: hypothetical protein Q8M26_04285 [Pseudolabrys sp.]|nr:hypothetical protein [Pseudolabrys sp.]
MVLTLALPAAAQEILGQGKTGAQLFASNCAICHKSPQGMTKAGGIFGLSTFLRQHYTSSRETAAAIAAYVESVDRAAPPPSKTPARRKTDDKGKPAAQRPAPVKPGETKPGETKPAETKPSDSAPVEAPEPAEAKPAEAKPFEAQPADSKAGEPKAAPASKPD